ncbi:MAG: DUF2845 domain-containing protein [Pseudomonadota bacterium]
MPAGVAMNSTSARRARRARIARTIAPLFLLGIAAGAPTVAESGPSGFRCPATGRLISLGQSLHEVRTRCREPDDAHVTVETRTIRERVRRWAGDVGQEVSVERTVEIPVEEWTYDFGRNRFVQFLRFENGRLISLWNGGKGSGDPE